MIRLIRLKIMVAQAVKILSSLYVFYLWITRKLSFYSLHRTFIMPNLEIAMYVALKIITVKRSSYEGIPVQGVTLEAKSLHLSASF